MSEDQCINGQGIRLVKQSEGEEVPLLLPWEIEGEKEMLKGTDQISYILEVEDALKDLHEHVKTCTNPECADQWGFDGVMYYRNIAFSMLKDGKTAMYTAMYGLIFIYILAKGDEPNFVNAVFAGLGVSLMGRLKGN
jgi:hypothetical protein